MIIVFPSLPKCFKKQFNIILYNRMYKYNMIYECTYYN